MRCQLLITDGNRQVILYPEDQDEKGVLKCLTSKEYDIEINMTDTNIKICQGGWFRNYGLGYIPIIFSILTIPFWITAPSLKSLSSRSGSLA